MAVATLKKKDVSSVLAALPSFLKLPRRFWVDYDVEADVLYLSFRKPQRATETEMLEDGVLVRSAGNQVVGVTVLDASTRKP